MEANNVALRDNFFFLALRLASPFRVRVALCRARVTLRLRLREVLCSHEGSISAYFFTWTYEVRHAGR